MRVAHSQCQSKIPLRSLISFSVLIAAVAPLGHTHAQPAFEWVKFVWQASNPSPFPVASYIAVDDSGNCFAAGTLPGQAFFYGTNFNGQGLNAFLAKYSPAGSLMWAIGEAGWEGVSGIAVDRVGNCYLTRTSGTLGKYNGSGVRQWLRQIGNYAAGVAVDSAGNAYVPSGTEINKIDPDGNSVTVATMQGSSSFSVRAVTVNQADSVLLTGYFSGRLLLSGTPSGGTNLFSRGQSDVFVAKYDTNGNLGWIAQAGGTNYDFSYAIAADAADNSYISGEFGSIATFGTITVTNRNPSNDGMFVAKLDSGGNFVWVRQGSLSFGFINDLVPKIAADAAGNVYLVNSFNGVESFAGLSLRSQGGTDAVVAKYDTDGNLVWAESAGGARDDYGSGIGANRAGIAYMVGNLTSPGIFDCSIVGVDTVPKMYIAKLAANPSPHAPEILNQPSSQTVDEANQVTFAATACGSQLLNYQWFHDWNSVASATNASLTFTNAGFLNAGLYSVVVSNPYGSITSSVATLIVNVRCGSAEASILPPSNLTWRSNGFAVTLNGKVNPQGRETVAWFEVRSTGSVTNYTTPPQSVGNGTSPVPFAQRVVGWPGVNNPYRLIVSNSFGVCFAGDQTLQLSYVATFGPWLANLPRLTRVDAAAWGDYDNDGFPDILLTGSTGNGQQLVSILCRNNRDGTFTDVGAGLAGVAGASIAWGDYDNDGYQDILLTGITALGAVTKIYRNNHNGSFTEINADIKGVYWGSVAWGDYNKDGRLDILMAGFADNINFTGVTRLYRNDGGGSLTEVSTGLPNLGYAFVAWGDYDNDGYPDILLTGSSNSVPVSNLYHNNRNGTFSPVSAGFKGLAYGSAAWGDFDNDGKIDLLLSGYNSPGLSGPTTKVYRNNGDGTFVDYGIGIPYDVAGSVAWGDYDNDGRLDIAISGRGFQGSRYAGVLRNLGNGIFLAIPAYLLSTDGRPQGSVAWADYDRDGQLDLLIAGTDGNAIIYRNNGDSPPKPKLAIQAGSLPDTTDWALTLDGITGRNYSIEASTNLTNWTPLTILMNATGNVQYVDTSSTNLASRFYRALVMP